MLGGDVEGEGWGWGGGGGGLSSTPIRLLKISRSNGEANHRNKVAAGSDAQA